MTSAHPVMARSEVDVSSMLAPLGVTADEEHVYRLLLADPGVSRTELAARSRLGPGRLRHAIEELERKAMVSRQGMRPVRFHPAPPGIVVDALISAREEELKQTRVAARQLSALLQNSADQLRVSQAVEVLTSPETVVRRWTQMQRAAKQTLEAFVRPPFTQPNLAEDESLQRSLHNRGCTVRGLYDQQALQSQGILDSLRRSIRDGEQARVTASLPVKLALFDRRIAFVPLGRTDDPTTLVVHESALLDALIALFDLYWQRGFPFAGGPEPDGYRPDPAEDEVLALMRAGLKDEAIARQLGVSTNTVRRRINSVAQKLGVSTRFQLGLAIGRPSGRRIPRIRDEVWPDTGRRDAATGRGAVGGSALTVNE